MSYCASEEIGKSNWRRAKSLWSLDKVETLMCFLASGVNVAGLTFLSVLRIGNILVTFHIASKS